jgi:hypothetical protein
VKLTAFFASLLICSAAAARDVGQIPPDTDSKTLTWFRMSKSPSGTSCCDEADGYREGVAVKMPMVNPQLFSGHGGPHLTAITLVCSIRPTSAQPNYSGMVRSFATTLPGAPWFGYRERTAFCWCAASHPVRKARKRITRAAES